MGCSACEAFMWLLLLALSWVALAACRRRRRDPLKASSTPPGPPPLPLVGNHPQLGDLPHRSLAGFARIYGPLMHLRLGRAHVFVASAPSVAKQVLHTHDHALSFRAAPDSARVARMDELSLAWMPPDDTWRRLRRLCNARLFAPQRLEANRGLRSRKAHELVSFVEQCARAGQAVDVGRTAFATTLNLVSNTVFSADAVAGHRAAEFKELVRQILKEAGSPNVADYFPLLRWVDPQGGRRRAAALLARLHKVFDGVIESRLKWRSVIVARGGGGGDEDFLDTLLDSLATSEMDRPAVYALLTDMFLAGSDTSSTTVEWAMAELIRSPGAMAKLRAELAEAMKPTSTTEKAGAVVVEESDVVAGRTPYLLAVLKETLRLHPPGPLLVPRRAAAAVEITAPQGATEGGGEGGGAARSYVVPEGATVIVNVWAIGRDPDVWGPGAEEFMPERFLEEGGGANAAGVEFRGWDMELIPFGAGRRICPALPLAAKMMQLMLANLVWSFEWVLPEGMAPADLDMTEAFGLSVCRAKPLLAIPRLR